MVTGTAAGRWTVRATCWKICWFTPASLYRIHIPCTRSVWDILIMYTPVPVWVTLFLTAPWPTRDARHGRLYIYTEPPETLQLGLQDKWMNYYYVNDDKYIKNANPISDFCDCPTCRQFSRGYLRHLYKQNDSLYLRLATMHILCAS